MPIFWDTATMQFSGRTMSAAAIRPHQLRVPSSLARNRSLERSTTKAAKAPPPQGPPRILFVQLRPRPHKAHPASYLYSEGPAPTRPRPSLVEACARARRREEVRPRAHAPSRPALLHSAMPRRKSASGGSNAAGPDPGRQVVLSRFFKSAGSLRSSVSPTEPAEKVEYGSTAPPAST